MEDYYMSEKSVYLTVRVLLLQCQFLGSCGLQNIMSSSARGLAYGHRYPRLWASLALQVGVSVMMHATLKLRRQSWAVTLFYDLRKWCYLAALLSTDGARLDLLRGLERWDGEMLKVNGGLKLLHYDPVKRGRFWHWTYHFFYTFGNNALSYTLFYPRDKTALALFCDVLVKTFAAQMVFLYTVIQLVFNEELSFRFGLVTASWAYHCRRLFSAPVLLAPLQEELRLRHAALASLAADLDHCFGRFFVVNLFFAFLETLMYLYRTMLADTNVFSNVQSVLFLAVNVVSVPLLATSSYSLGRASKGILRDLRAMKLSGQPRVGGKQVVLLMQQMCRDPLSVSACGFFSIDRQLIVSMIVSMTTYFMVIIQLGPELGTLTATIFGLE